MAGEGMQHRKGSGLLDPSLAKHLESDSNHQELFLLQVMCGGSLPGSLIETSVRHHDRGQPNIGVQLHREQKKLQSGK